MPDFLDAQHARLYFKYPSAAGTYYRLYTMSHGPSRRREPLRRQRGAVLERALANDVLALEGNEGDGRRSPSSVLSRSPAEPTDDARTPERQRLRGDGVPPAAPTKRTKRERPEEHLSGSVRRTLFADDVTSRDLQEGDSDDVDDALPVKRRKVDAALTPEGSPVRERTLARTPPPVGEEQSRQPRLDDQLGQDQGRRVTVSTTLLPYRDKIFVTNGLLLVDGGCPVYRSLPGPAGRGSRTAGGVYFRLPRKRRPNAVHALPQGDTQRALQEADGMGQEEVQGLQVHGGQPKVVHHVRNVLTPQRKDYFRQPMGKICQVSNRVDGAAPQRTVSQDEFIKAMFRKIRNHNQ